MRAKWCSRCQQPIREGERYTQYDADAGSAAATTVYWHRECPPKPRS